MKVILKIVSIIILMISSGLLALLFFGEVIIPSGSDTLIDTSQSELEADYRDFRQIQGTSIFVAEIALIQTDRPNYPTRWFGSGVYSSKNLVFLDSTSLQSHLLFETNDQFIVKLSQYPEPDLSSSGHAGDRIIEVRWLVYEVVMEDTNIDKKLNSDDLVTVAVSNADGNQYLELIKGVEEVYGMELLDDSTLLVMYQNSSGNFVSSIDLDKREILATQPLAYAEP